MNYLMMMILFLSLGVAEAAPLKSVEVEFTGGKSTWKLDRSGWLVCEPVSTKQTVTLTGFDDFVSGEWRPDDLSTGAYIIISYHKKETGNFFNLTAALQSHSDPVYRHAVTDDDQISDFPRLYISGGSTIKLGSECLFADGFKAKINYAEPSKPLGCSVEKGLSVVAGPNKCELSVCWNMAGWEGLAPKVWDLITMEGPQKKVISNFLPSQRELDRAPHNMMQASEKYHGVIRLQGNYPKGDYVINYVRKYYNNPFFSGGSHHSRSNVFTLSEDLNCN